LDKKEAFYAFQEGIKHIRTNWKIWQNFLYVCMVMNGWLQNFINTGQDLAEYQLAVSAVQEILNLKGNEVDVEVIHSWSLD
jgi:hypothetical protein